MGSRALRVLHLLDSLDIGGTESNAVRVLRELKASGTDVRLGVFRSGPLEAEVVTAGVPLQRFSVGSFYSPALLSLARSIGREARRDGIQLLHAHDRYSNVLAALVRRLGARIPLLVSKRWDNTQDPWPMRTAAGWAFRSASLVLANSEAVARSVPAVERVDASRVRVIPNFVDDALFEAEPATLRLELRRELGIPADSLVVVSVANLRPVKNHAMLLDAMALLRERVPGVLLLLVGDGPSRAGLEHRAAALGLDGQIRFLGQRAAGWRMHAAGDLSVLSSVSEGFPNALVEAQALSVPVVATAVGGVPEVVIHQQSGLLVPEGDAAGLAEALRTLLEDAGARHRMGEAGRAGARERYSRRAVISRLVALYEELVPG
jgi:glycosyltransferase involved in cell wall biosynthesis